jgi:hypothetical protein
VASFFDFLLGVGSDKPSSSVIRTSLIKLHRTAECYRNALNKAVNYMTSTVLMNTVRTAGGPCAPQS